MNSSLARRLPEISAPLQPQIAAKPESRIKKIWLGIYFPEIALSAAYTHTCHCEARSDTAIHTVSGQAQIVVQQQGSQNRVYVANASAAAYGIQPGLALNAAYVLCRDLSVTLRKEQAERRLLASYAQRLLHFTPDIALSGTDVILLEVNSSLKLFGGFKALYAQLQQTLATLPHKIACAPLAAVAELMALNSIEAVLSDRSRLQSALGEIALSQTPLDRGLLQRLERCGLYQLRDVWRLPRADLARRFGMKLLTYMDELSGQSESPRAYIEPDMQFACGCDLEQESSAADILIQAAKLLLQKAQQFLQTRALLSERIRFDFIYTHRRGESRQSVSLVAHAQQGGNQASHFLPQLEQQLQQQPFEQAVIRIELCIEQFKACQLQTADLFKPVSRRAESWPALLDILRARLGRQTVYRLVIQADHRPEKAWRRTINGNTAHKAKVSSRHLPPRPVWLLPQALRSSLHMFQLGGDAERLESGWWSDADLRREYYQAVTPSGQRCWLYRDLKSSGSQWYVHGLFG